MYNVSDSLNNRDNNFTESVIFDEIELNLSRSCNKTCISCPHSTQLYTDTNKNYQVFMELETIENVLKELDDNNYVGMIDIAGMGEPSLNQHFLKCLKLIKEYGFRARVVTNGVRLSSETFRKKLKNILDDSKIHCVISAYNSKDANTFNKYNIGEIKEIFIEEEFELMAKKFKLNNRGGAVNIPGPISKFKSCNYCFFMIFIDTNGDMQFCPHQWTKELTLANIKNEKIFDVWNKPHPLRDAMLDNKRQELDICKNCTAPGTLIGNNKKELFEKQRNQNQI